MASRSTTHRDQAEHLLPGERVVDVLVGRAGSSPRGRIVRSVLITATAAIVYLALVVGAGLHPVIVAVAMVVIFVLAYPAFLALFDPMWFIVVTRHDLVLLRFKARNAAVVGHYPKPLKAVPPTRARWVSFEVGPERIWVRRLEYGATIDKYS